MIGDTVAIEIPKAVSEQDVGRAIAACEAALGDDRCGHSDQGFVANFLAQVTESTATELTIELKQTGRDEVVALRVLRFTEEEPDTFRWQSAGVVVAALVLSQTQAQPPSPSDSPEPAAAAPDPEQSDPPKVGPTSPGEAVDSGKSQEETEPDVATIDFGPLIASTASGAGVAGGGSLGGALRLSGPLHVVASGEASVSSADDAAIELRSRSLSGSLGLALRHPLPYSGFEWELSVRGAFQRLRVSATSDTRFGEAATSRWGGRAGAALAWLPSPFLGVVAGADAGLAWPPVDVEVGIPEPLRISALIWSGYLGIRIRLNRM